jgi:hypothetical protein
MLNRATHSWTRLRMVIRPVLRFFPNAFLLATAVACSGGGGVTLGATCGAGTTAENGQCVVGSSADASMTDASTIDASIDALFDEADTPRGNPVDSSAADSLTDSGVDAPSGPDGPVSNPIDTPDPCPDSSLPPLWADCSGQCASAGGSFDASSCGTSGNYPLVCPGAYTPGLGPYTYTPNMSDFTLRTPGNAVPACLVECPSDAGPQVTAAIVFAAGGDPKFTIEVGLPWRISAIPYQNFPQGTFFACVGPSITPLSGSCVNADVGLYAVWTDAPDPPARNIVVHQNVVCP